MVPIARGSGPHGAGGDSRRIEKRLREDTAHAFRAVCVVHNETSNGTVTRVDEVRRQIDAARHPALLLVDARRRAGDRLKAYRIVGPQPWDRGRRFVVELELQGETAPQKVR